MNSANARDPKRPTQTNEYLIDRKMDAIARGQGHAMPAFVDRASGSEFWDVEGKRYIDFATGIAVCNLGHGHPAIIDAVKDQLDRFSHTCVMVTPYESAVELAENLNRLAPGPSRKKTVFITTGAEAVENTIKIARAHTGRRGIIAFNGGFHGRTLLAMGLTGKITPYKNHFGPFPADVFHVPFPIDYHGVTIDAALGALDSVFQVDIAPTDVAAIIVEPVQGEGGFYPAPDAFLQRLRELCDEHGIVLVVDEIQTGFGRTGTFFACERAGIEPDLMTTAKGIAGGFPIAAVVGKAEIMDAPLPGGLGGTYAGSPIGCAAALAVIRTIENERLVERANEIGGRFRSHLKKLEEEHPDFIGEARTNRGAMIAVELVEAGTSKQPNAKLTKAVIAKCHKRGLAVLSCGANYNVVRFLPALTISNALIDEGLKVFADCLSDAIAAETMNG